MYHMDRITSASKDLKINSNVKDWPTGMDAYISLLVSIMMLISISSCLSPDGHHDITVVNNSNVDLYVVWGTSYPDTLFDYFNQTYHGNYKLPANATRTLACTWQRETWEGYFSNIKSDTLIIYCIDALRLDSICIEQEKDDWASYRDNEDILMKRWNDLIVLKRVFLSLDYLNQNDWTITYP